jgi:hypothetical protein
VRHGRVDLGSRVRREEALGCRRRDHVDAAAVRPEMPHDVLARRLRVHDRARRATDGGHVERRGPQARKTAELACDPLVDAVIGHDDRPSSGDRDDVRGAEQHGAAMRSTRKHELLPDGQRQPTRCRHPDAQVGAARQPREVDAGGHEEVDAIERHVVRGPRGREQLEVAPHRRPPTRQPHGIHPQGPHRRRLYSAGGVVLYRPAMIVAGGSLAVGALDTPRRAAERTVAPRHALLAVARA